MDYTDFYNKLKPFFTDKDINQLYQAAMAYSDAGNDSIETGMDWICIYISDYCIGETPIETEYAIWSEFDIAMKEGKAVALMNQINKEW